MDKKELFIIIIGTIISIALFISMLIISIHIISIQWYSLNISQPFPVKCWINNKLIYEGKAACISTHSEGANTSVQINGGFMCLFPQQYYVAKDIRLEGKR